MRPRRPLLAVEHSTGAGLDLPLHCVRIRVWFGTDPRLLRGRPGALLHQPRCRSWDPARQRGQPPLSEQSPTVLEGPVAAGCPRLPAQGRVLAPRQVPYDPCAVWPALRPRRSNLPIVSHKRRSAEQFLHWPYRKQGKQASGSNYTRHSAAATAIRSTPHSEPLAVSLAHSMEPMYPNTQAPCDSGSTDLSALGVQGHGTPGFLRLGSGRCRRSLRGIRTVCPAV